MKKIFLLFVLALFLLTSACGAATETSDAVQTPLVVESTSTPDPCSAANLPEEIAKAHKPMREFDDYSALASNTPQNQLILVIPDLQRVLRDAQDQTVPDCLVTLKKIQLAHMSTVVQTLMGFMNATGEDPAGVDKVNAGIEQARNLRGQYNIEMARLLGITLVAPPTLTPGADSTQTIETPTASAANGAITVTNKGTGAINLRITPDLNGLQAGILGSQISTVAFGKSADDQWIQVQTPGNSDQKAWVFASLVQLSVPIDSLPVVNP